jgi:hypothetical protein
MVEVKHSGKSMEQRIADRLKPSCGDADTVVTHGTGPTRTATAIHHGGTARHHGAVNAGEGDIHGKKRGTV